MLLATSPTYFEASEFCGKYKVKRGSGQAVMRGSDISPDLERRGGLI
jgi:hypothetical protein